MPVAFPYKGPAQNVRGPSFPGKQSWLRSLVFWSSPEAVLWICELALLRGRGRCPTEAGSYGIPVLEIPPEGAM
jgi:hypothetical protein